jgi:Ser/Thr protein kinase RdoA (MazF antagonist)
MGPLVLKAYGRERQFEAARAGLLGAGRAPLCTAPFEAAVPELRLTAQRSLEGELPASARAVARDAGALVSALQRAPVGALAVTGPERVLEAAARKAAVVEAVLPHLEGRLRSLVRRLGDSLPAGLALVPAHGDFHADQLLLGKGEIAVIDFDQMCLAAPALDLATYAADVVRGRGADLERVHAVLEPLLEGFGRRPEALDWHLAAAILGRAAHPFQRQVPEWQARSEATLATAEASLG